MTATPQIAVITANRRMQRYVTRALALAGWELHFADFDPERAAVQIAADRDLYLLDGAGDGPALRALVERIHETRPAALARVVLLQQRLDDPLLAELFTTKGIDHFVGRHAGSSPYQDLIDEAELIVTAKKILEQDFFGLDKYLSSWGVQIHRDEIGSTTDKSAAVAQLENFLNRIDCAAAIGPAVNLVAEELLMNAIFSAPRAADGTARYATRARADALTLEPAERCCFAYGCDGRHLGLSVSDPFGSLMRKELVRYLTPSFVGAPGQMEDKQGGAGLGLYMSFNSATQLIFNIVPGQRTEVIALFFIRSGARAFRSSARSLNVFFGH